MSFQLCSWCRSSCDVLSTERASPASAMQWMYPSRWPTSLSRFVCSSMHVRSCSMRPYCNPSSFTGLHTQTLRNVAAGLSSAQLAWLLVGVTPVFIAQTFHHHPAAPALLHFNSTSTPGALPASASAPPSGLQGATPSEGLSHHLLYVLLSGLVASRFGLWLFDLAVTQLQQELVADTELGE